jgi:hypothetical protein
VQQKDLVRSVTLDGTEIQLALGETVWYFGAAQTSDRPIPATVQSFGEDNMVDLVYHEQATGRPQIVKGLCMLTDPRLENMVFRKRGAWCPRGVWTCLEIKG